MNKGDLFLIVVTCLLGTILWVWFGVWLVQTQPHMIDAGGYAMGFMAIFIGSCVFGIISLKQKIF